MDSFMIGIDVRDSGKTRVSILEPAHDMAIETFSFATRRGPSPLTRRLEFWSEQGMDLVLAICPEDPWSYDLSTHIDPTWRIHHLQYARVEEIRRRAESTLGCALHRHRSKLLAFLSKYHIVSLTPADLGRKWAIRMAREFLFSACYEAKESRRRQRHDNTGTPARWEPDFLEEGCEHA